MEWCVPMLMIDLTKQEYPSVKTSTRSRLHVLLAMAVAATTAGSALAQRDIRSERIQFKKGASSAIVNGRIKGYDTVDYLIGARKGQTANISLATKHTATYFNILAPGKTDEAFFNGSLSTSLNQFEGVLPADGTYRVRVYMMRAAARRNEVASFRLEVAISGAAAVTVAPKPSVDAKVPGTDFHATGPLPCAIGSGAAMTPTCTFGVKREGQGSGRVELTKPDGSKRTVFFQQGRATGYDAGQAPLKAMRQGDATIVQIDDERYEIPDAVINGG
jgi:hypothetical protein